MTFKQDVISLSIHSSSMRPPLQASDVVDRETEILQLEEKAIDGLKEEDTGGALLVLLVGFGGDRCGFYQV